MLLLILLAILVIGGTILGIYFGVQAYKKKQAEQVGVGLAEYAVHAAEFGTLRDPGGSWPAISSQIQSAADTVSASVADSGKISNTAKTQAKAAMTAAKAAVQPFRNLTAANGVGEDVVQEWRDFIKKTDEIARSIPA